MLLVFIDADNVASPVHDDFGVMAALLNAAKKIVIRANNEAAAKKWGNYLLGKAGVDVSVIDSALVAAEPQAADVALVGELAAAVRRGARVVLLSRDVMLMRLFAAVCAKRGARLFEHGLAQGAVRAKAQPSKPAAVPAGQRLSEQALIDKWIEAHPKFDRSGPVPGSALKALANKHGMSQQSLQAADRERLARAAAVQALPVDGQACAALH